MRTVGLWALIVALVVAGIYFLEGRRAPTRSTPIAQRPQETKPTTATAAPPSGIRVELEGASLDSVELRHGLAHVHAGGIIVELYDRKIECGGGANEAMTFVSFDVPFGPDGVLFGASEVSLPIRVDGLQATDRETGWAFEVPPPFVTMTARLDAGATRVQGRLQIDWRHRVGQVQTQGWRQWKAGARASGTFDVQVCNANELATHRAAAQRRATRRGAVTGTLLGVPRSTLAFPVHDWISGRRFWTLAFYDRALACDQVWFVGGQPTYAEQLAPAKALYLAAFERGGIGELKGTVPVSTSASADVSGAMRGWVRIDNAGNAAGETVRGSVAVFDRDGNEQLGGEFSATICPASHYGEPWADLGPRATSRPPPQTADNTAAMLGWRGLVLDAASGSGDRITVSVDPGPAGRYFAGSAILVPAARDVAWQHNFHPLQVQVELDPFDAAKATRVRARLARSRGLRDSVSSAHLRFDLSLELRLDRIKDARPPGPLPESAETPLRGRRDDRDFVPESTLAIVRHDEWTGVDYVEALEVYAERGIDCGARHDALLRPGADVGVVRWPGGVDAEHAITGRALPITHAMFTADPLRDTHNVRGWVRYDRLSLASGSLISGAMHVAIGDRTTLVGRFEANVCRFP